MPNLSKVVSVLAFSLIFSSSLCVANDIDEINQLFRKGELNTALIRVNQYLEKNPKDAQARFLKGLILADQNNPTEAIEVFTSLTQDYPELPEPYNNLAVLYAAQGKYEAAKNALEMAIRTHPSYATAHENLGDLYAKMAAIAYDKALQIDSGNKTAQAKLSFIREMMSGQERRPAAVAQSKPDRKPASTTAPVPVATPPSIPSDYPAPNRMNKQDIIQAVQSWAKAWSDQDVDAYLDHYSADFTPSSMSRAAWEAQRRERIKSPKSISVTLENIQVMHVSNNRATVRFTQIYESDRLKSQSDKTLELALIKGKWLITRESWR